jgi:ribosomal protein S19E (S16A)
MNDYGNPTSTYTYAETVPSKVPEIQLVTDQLEKEIYRLDEELKGLSARLSSITLPDVAKTGTKLADGAPQQPHSDFYMRLAGIARRLAEINVFLSDLKQRLEL